MCCTLPPHQLVPPSAGSRVSLHSSFCMVLLTWGFDCHPLPLYSIPLHTLSICDARGNTMSSLVPPCSGVAVACMGLGGSLGWTRCSRVGPLLFSFPACFVVSFSAAPSLVPPPPPVLVAPCNPLCLYGTIPHAV